MQRLFVNAALEAGAELAASEAQAHYLSHVLRLGPGAEVAVFNGRDGEYLARMGAARRGQATLILAHRLRAQAPSPDLWLVFAPLKRDATDLAVRQATEMGVSALVPVFCEHSNTGRINPERWAAIAREAAEQCERLDVPEIREPAKFFDLLALWPAGRRLAAAVERRGAAPVPAGAGALLVGPEGGFAPSELDALARASFVSPICLGPRVLRAETAIVAGLALLQEASWSASSARV